jgi:hypothetical protein
MKIAICFAGQFRNLERNYPNFKEMILDANTEHEIDFFVHGWFDKSVPDTEYLTAVGGRASTPVPRDVLAQLYECYNPKVVMLEHQIEFDAKNYHDNKYPGINPKYSLSRMYSVFQVNRARLEYQWENKIRYDVVVSTRYDWAFREPVKFETVTESAIYHPGLNPHGINVGWIMGPSFHMDAYSKLFYNVDLLFQQGVSFTDEILAERYLTDICRFKIIPFNISAYMNRD